MAFFDEPRNAVGRLNTRLSTDAALVRSGTGEALGVLLAQWRHPLDSVPGSMIAASLAHVKGGGVIVCSWVH